MQDLISRQALCDYALNQKDKSVTPNDIMRFPSAQPEITEEDVRGWCYKRCLTIIDNALYLEMRSRWLPSAQPEQRWIPCSERLPEVGTYVLVSKKSLGFRSNLPNVYTAHRSHDPRSGKEEWNDMLFGKLDDDDVLAWMPLPAEYKERQEE